MNETLNPPECMPIQVLNTPLTKPPQRRLKLWVTLNIMVKLQLSLSIVMIILQSITMGVLIDSHLPTGICELPATGIWVGVFGVIAGGLGVGGFKCQYGNKCLIVAHFVMSIISIIADGILIILVSFCLDNLQDLQDWYEYYFQYDPTKLDRVRSIGRGISANESLLIIAGIVHFITSIVSAAFVCSNLCGRREEPVKTVYVREIDGNVIGGSTVQVLPGTQMYAEPSAPSVYMPNGIRSPDGNAIVGPCRVQVVQSGTHMYVVPNENAQQQQQQEHHVYQKY